MTITISSWKGGTGKTTLSVMLAEFLVAKGFKVLIIDLDPNCAISQIYKQIFKDVTSLEFLTGVWEKFSVYSIKEKLDIIPGNLNNVLLQNIMDLSMKNNLKRSGFKDNYDFIIIDPPGYWGAHTRNAVFASDVLVIPGTCSRIDFEASKLYFKTLQQNCIEANTFVCVNAFNAEMNLPGIYEAYQEEFKEFLLEKPIPYIKSLKKLTNDTDYVIQSNIKNRLEFFVQAVLKAGGL
ncbi:chromosome partitioning protein ParA [Spirochaetia bacterium]|nr:chromosome partitioning protein ParA [Spirochaetia bacterium]